MFLLLGKLLYLPTAWHFVALNTQRFFFCEVHPRVDLKPTVLKYAISEWQFIGNGLPLRAVLVERDGVSEVADIVVGFCERQSARDDPYRINRVPVACSM